MGKEILEILVKALINKKIPNFRPIGYDAEDIAVEEKLLQSAHINR
jgi:hypothetical protein